MKLSSIAESRRIATANGYNEFLHVATESRPDSPMQTPSADSVLFGVPFSVKDNLAVAGMPMTCGSRHLEAYHPPYTATVVVRMRRAGAHVIGKTNMDEFGCGSSGETSAFGATRNPADVARVPGGSSSGAAASVAGGAAWVALGSDTGGSIRCPASFCGVVGFKPSYGRVSRYGLADMAMSLESPAPIAADVALCAATLDVISGEDPHDMATIGARPTAAADAVRRVQSGGDRAALRVGVVRSFWEGVEPATRKAVEDAVGRLADAGAKVTEVEIPSVSLALPAYYSLCYAEFSSAMQRYDGFLYGHGGSGGNAAAAAARSRAVFGREVKRRILLGTLVTGAAEAPRWYASARRIRQRLAQEVALALEGRDVLVGPTMPFRAFRLGERLADPLAMYAADILTVVANLARVPAGSVPAKGQGSLPIGIQVIGRDGEDEKVLAAMAEVEMCEGRAPALRPDGSGAP
ncbi:MAG: amidase family protein [Thermoplasmatota archaeon]